jgi:phenylalanyl-tRNA synthetase beta chain
MPFLEPGYGFALHIEGQPAGWLGLIAPAIRKEWRLNDPVAVLEVSVAPVAHHAAPRLTYQPVPTYPSVTRDVALVADASLRHDDIIAAMRKAGPPELESIALFDIFTGASLGEGKRSLAYALTYRSSGRTLTDDEVNVYHEHVKRELKASLQIDIREG